MLKFIDLVYHSHQEYDRPQQVIEKHAPTLGFIEYIKERMQVEVIRHLNYEGKEIINDVPYVFFKRSNSAKQIPFATHHYIRSLEPDIILVHGMLFPLQVIALRMTVGKKPVIILQHHGGKPAPSVTRIFQRFADRFVSAYLFTAKGIAKPWLEQRIISSPQKVCEVTEASPFVEKRDKMTCRATLLFQNETNFLWVGRLDNNKDPLTVLQGFFDYLQIQPAAILYLVYSEDKLLPAVQNFIRQNKAAKNIRLIGKQNKEQLTVWYNAADYFISGSHDEGSGYALMEAMSVGCIPVLTMIPSFKKIAGDTGFFFEAGNPESLTDTLQQTISVNINERSAKTAEYFRNNLSHKNIADDIFLLSEKLFAEN